MPATQFFDVNVILGRPNIPKYRWFEDFGEMKRDLARFGVTGGLVRHTLGEEAHPAAGNARIAEELGGDSDFRPVWTLLPHHTGEMPSPRGLIEQMKAAAVAAAIIYPQAHGFTPSATVCGGLFEALEEAGVPLLLPQAQASLSTVEEIARAHPALPIIQINAAYKLSRDLYAILEACGNLHVETSMYMVHQGVDEFCRLFGAERLVFGTNSPTYHPGCAVAGVNYAGISEREKELIASGNAKRLLKGARR